MHDNAFATKKSMRNAAQQTIKQTKTNIVSTFRFLEAKYSLQCSKRGETGAAHCGEYRQAAGASARAVAGVTRNVVRACERVRGCPAASRRLGVSKNQVLAQKGLMPSQLLFA
jgi:hypothetical protein